MDSHHAQDNRLDDASLHYAVHNPAAKSTVILIHGAYVSGENWDLVVPHLSTTHHLLIPDLPGHGQSQNTTPFSVEISSRLLARLISKHAIGGRAHVVGHSLGSHVAINLASSYPEVVRAVFVSGFEIYPRTIISRFMPYGMWIESRIQKQIPRRLMKWLMDGTDLPRGGTCTLDLCRQVAIPMTSKTWPSSWSARTLIIAAGKGGIIPSQDHPQDSVRLMGIGRERNLETFAVIHPDMRHPWNRQDPALFAETARTWFEGEDLPSGFMRFEV